MHEYYLLSSLCNQDTCRIIDVCLVECALDFLATAKNFNKSSNMFPSVVGSG